MEAGVQEKEKMVLHQIPNYQRGEAEVSNQMPKTFKQIKPYTGQCALQGDWKQPSKGNLGPSDTWVPIHVEQKNSESMCFCEAPQKSFHWKKKNLFELQMHYFPENRGGSWVF